MFPQTTVEQTIFSILEKQSRAFLHNVIMEPSKEPFLSFHERIVKSQYLRIIPPLAFGAGL